MRRIAVLAAVVAVAGFAHPLSAQADDVGQNEKIIVKPPQGRVGQKFDITCSEFPEPTQRDVVYVAPVGTPDVDPYAPEAQGEKILWKDYAANCYRNNGRFFSPAGPFAPGNYEVRFITRLYNNDDRPEVATRTPFSVR